MKYKVIQYSLCVWLTTVAIAPSFLLGILYFSGTHTDNEQCTPLIKLLSLYCWLIMAHLIFSFITWLVFLIITAIITQLAVDRKLMMWLIFITAVLLTFV